MPAALGDQTDPRLDALFETLASTADPAEGASASEQIWQIWFEHADDEIERKLRQGHLSMQRRNFEVALEAFNEVIEAAPEFAEGWNRRATLYWLMGDHASSGADVKRTLELEPRHFGAMSGLGLLYTELEQYEAAVRAFEDALVINPHMIGPRRNIEHLRKQLEDAKI